MMFAEMVDLSIPLLDNRSFVNEVPSAVPAKEDRLTQLDTSSIIDNRQSFTDNRKEEVLAKIKRVYEERKRRYDVRLENYKKGADTHYSPKKSFSETRENSNLEAV